MRNKCRNHIIFVTMPDMRSVQGCLDMNILASILPGIPEFFMMKRQDALIRRDMGRFQVKLWTETNKIQYLFIL